MSYIYLASPYTHPDKSVMEDRYNAALRAVVKLLKGRQWVYSPIIHCHPLAVAYDLPRSHLFWLDYNRAMLAEASEMRVLMLEGWQESLGVGAEIEMATELAIPFFYWNAGVEP